MFPSSKDNPPPPGVFVSEDQSEVTSPLSIAEWLLGFHAEARKTRGCMEGICGEGEVLHVPSGRVVDPRNCGSDANGALTQDGGTWWSIYDRQSPSRRISSRRNIWALPWNFSATSRIKSQASGQRSRIHTRHLSTVSGISL